MNATEANEFLTAIYDAVLPENWREQVTKGIQDLKSDPRLSFLHDMPDDVDEAIKWAFNKGVELGLGKPAASTDQPSVKEEN